jgi:hypothetical protein
VHSRKESEKSITREAHNERPKVERVLLSTLKPRRRGKHFELMQQILKELADLPIESALKVPLGSHSAKDLRSAVARAASSQKIAISSTSDNDSLYVWKRR